MTTAGWSPAWLWLGAALLLVPAADLVRDRLRHLSRLGRLGIGPEPLPRSAKRFAGWRAAAEVPSLIVGAVVGVPTVVAAGPPLGLAAGVAAATGWHLAQDAARRQSDRLAIAALLSGLRIMVAELTAGSRPPAALDAASAASSPRHAEALAAAAERARAGADADAELGGSPDLLPLAHAWRLAAVTGAPLAEVTARVADDLAGRVRQQHKVSAAVAGPRSSAALLALLPALGLILGSTMDANPVGFLLGTGVGRWVLLAGVVLDVAGLLWTQRLLSRAERA